MPRSVEARVSFQHDLAFLMRLTIAVEKDGNMSTEEKNVALKALSEISKVFHTVEIRRQDKKLASNG